MGRGLPHLLDVSVQPPPEQHGRLVETAICTSTSGSETSSLSFLAVHTACAAVHRAGSALSRQRRVIERRRVRTWIRLWIQSCILVHNQNQI